MLRVISLGAGVQSTTMALMAAHGEIGPMPDCAIFADTGCQIMADELKPCPFCGGEARMFYVDGWARPRCKCGANSGVLAGSDSEAVAAWNRRPAPAVGESEPVDEAVDDTDPSILAAARAIYEIKPDDPWGGQPFMWMALHPKRRANFVQRANAAVNAWRRSKRDRAGIGAVATDAELSRMLADWEQVGPALCEEAASRITSLSDQVKSLAWEIDNPETGWRVRVERAEDDAWRKNEAVFSFYMREIDAERALAVEREAHHRDVRQFSELADAQRRRAEAAEQAHAGTFDLLTERRAMLADAESRAVRMREALDSAESILRYTPEMSTNCGGTKPNMTTRKALTMVRAARQKKSNG